MVEFGRGLWISPGPNFTACKWHVTVSAGSFFQGLKSFIIWIGDLKIILAGSETCSYYIAHWVPPRSRQGLGWTLSHHRTPMLYKPICDWTWEPPNPSGSASLNIFEISTTEQGILVLWRFTLFPTLMILLLFSSVTIYILISTLVLYMAAQGSQDK